MKRDGAFVKMPIEKLVPMDVIDLYIGCSVPADVRLHGELEIDQSRYVIENSFLFSLGIIY